MQNSPVQQIKERITIEEVVSSYIKLDNAGSNLKARCPFHNEKTPSFFISKDRGTYYCFGCGASGDIFSFVEEFEGLDFKGALKLLALRAGVELGSFSKEQNSEKDRLYLVMEEATKFYIANLENNKEAQDYLKSRGITDKTVKDFRLGFIKDDWRLLYNYLKTKGYLDEEIEKAGLAKKSEKGYYDRFRNRIMFPISDSSGRVIAFSGRLFVDDGKSAKYLNSPETPIFKKSAVFYGLDKAKNSIRNNNFSILVEGQMDLLMAHQTLYKNTIATSGTALSDSEFSKENIVSNLGLVRRLSNNIVLAFDGDNAGIKATERAGKIILSLGMDVKVVVLPKDIDPADLILKDGESSWKDAIKNSKHLIMFLLEKVIEESFGDSRKIGLAVKDKILSYIDILPSAIEKSHFLKKISEATMISVSALEEDLKRVEKEQKSERQEIEQMIENSNKMSRKDHIERDLSGIAFWQQSLAKPIIDFKFIFEKLGEVYKKYEDDRENLIFKAELSYTDSQNLDKNVNEMLFYLEEENINEEIAKNMLQLRQATQDEIKNKISKDIYELQKKKEDIKNGRLKK